MRARILLADGVHVPGLLGRQPAKATGVHKFQVSFLHSRLMLSLSLIVLVLSPRLPLFNQHVPIRACLSLCNSWWDVNNLLAARGGIVDRWGVPERANGVIQFVEVPEGWESACLVPYYPDAQVLAPIAMVEHERVRYSTDPSSRAGKMLLTDLLADVQTHGETDEQTAT